jgi:tRNA-splicing ligase RtcB
LEETMKYILDKGLPIKSWCNNPEPGCIEQASHLAQLPFAFKHIALMPDTHQGYGMPVGGVMATEGVIVPNAVGVDIGCGMLAQKTDLTEITTETLKKIMGKIREAVPVGFGHHKEPQSEIYNLYADGIGWIIPGDSVVSKEITSASRQIGTLGGGNHFIEIQKGNDGFIYFMLHSGSRNVGLKVANHYNRKAVELNETWRSSIPKEWELAFLPEDSDLGKSYLAAMNFCLKFALENRRLMAKRIREIFFGEAKCVFGDEINIHHNYVAKEHHYGRDVWVHRKGATLANVGQYGIIPGSQGTHSYIVAGKGNPLSFNSCSHGAGRRMGRKVAQRTLNLEEQQKMLNDQGIVHAVRTADDLDEAPGSYKDIATVMDEQKDLVEITVELTPLGVIKG